MATDQHGGVSELQEPWNGISLVNYLRRDTDDAFTTITHAKVAYAIVKLVAIVILLHAVVTLVALHDALGRFSAIFFRLEWPSGDIIPIHLSDIVAGSIFITALGIVLGIIVAARLITQALLRSTRQELGLKATAIEQSYGDNEEIPADLKELLSRMRRV